MNTAPAQQSTVSAIQGTGRPKAHLAARHARVRKAMEDLQLDGLLLTHIPDLAYLTDLTCGHSFGLITQSGFQVASGFVHREHIRLEAPWAELTIWEQSPSHALASIVTASRASRIGFEANFTTVGQINALRHALESRADSIEFVPLEDVMISLRAIKDDQEIDQIRKSVEISEEAFEAIKPEIKPGQSENLLAGMLIMELRARGASDTSFQPSIAAGASSALPHYRPGETLLKRDQAVLFDWGAVVKGYCSDLTRTFVLGDPPRKFRDLYKLVLEAQQAAIATARPGVLSSEVDRAARDVINRAGYGDFFGHNLGHGIGRDIHEFPRLRRSGEPDQLRPGMVVTIEPGIYIPGEFGIRIEDDVLITHSGCEVLSTLDRSLEGCHLQ